MACGMAPCCRDTVTQIREFLEKHYTTTSGRDTIKLVIRSLMETVEAGSKSIDVAVMEKDTGLRLLTDEDVDAIVKEVRRHSERGEMSL